MERSMALERGNKKNTNPSRTSIAKSTLSISTVNIKKPILALGAITCLLTLALSQYLGDDDTPSAPTPAPPVAPVPASLLARADPVRAHGGFHGRAEGFSALFSSNTILQSARWDRSDSYVDITEKEKVAGPGVTGWAIDEYRVTASFNVADVSARTLNELCVLGVSPSGEDVIEFWKIEQQAGAPDIRRSTGVGTAIGFPMDPTVTLASPPIGGVGIPAGERTGSRSILRTEIFRGDLGGLLCGQVEMEGRYLAVATIEPPRLVQLIPSEPYWIEAQSWGAGVVPNLGTAVSIMSGRLGQDTCLIVSSSFASAGQDGFTFPRTYVWDSGNDGVLDSLETFDPVRNNAIPDPYDGNLDEIMYAQ